MVNRVNSFLIHHGKLDISSDPVIGIVVHSSCNYFRSAAFPSSLEAGINILKLGKSSVTYQIGIFDECSNDILALGTFVHVFVQRDTMKPTLIPDKLRIQMEKIQVQ